MLSLLYEFIGPIPGRRGGRRKEEEEEEFFNRYKESLIKDLNPNIPSQEPAAPLRAPSAPGALFPHKSKYQTSKVLQ